ncbi:restriction endonuclease, partial [bacterium]|nr:restriction endonuclease [bacterium]
MDTTKLKKFAQAARKQLLKQVAARLAQVLATDSPARREHEKAVRELEKHITQTSKDTVIEEAAYTWFNRFCALRFMDINHYT